MAGGLAHRHDVADCDALTCLRRQALQCELLPVADDPVDLGHRGVARWVELGGAAGGDDGCLGVLPPGAADRLACLSLGLASDRTGIDDDALGQARSTRTAAHDLRLVGVEPAAHGDDLEPTHPGSTPVKLEAVGAGHLDMAVLAPDDPQRATVEDNVDIAPGDPPPRACYRCGAGAGAAGARQAGAALPHAEPETVFGKALGNANVRALGKERIGLQPRADLGQWHGLGVVHEEHRVRVAHVDRHGVRERPCADRDVERVHRAGQGDLVPVEPRRPHIDAHLACTGLVSRERPGIGFQDHTIRAGLIQQQPGRAAGAVAAGRDLAAVLVPEPEVGVGAAVTRRLQDDQLIAADTSAPVGDGAHARAVQRERRLACIEHHEVVAEPVHLGEGKPRHGGVIGADGERRHRFRRRPAVLSYPLPRYMPMTVSSMASASERGRWKLLRPMIEPLPPPAWIARTSPKSPSSPFAAPPEKTTSRRPAKAACMMCAIRFSSVSPSTPWAP